MLDVALTPDPLTLRDVKVPDLLLTRVPGKGKAKVIVTNLGNVPVPKGQRIGATISGPVTGGW